MKYLAERYLSRELLPFYNTKADVDRWLEALKEKVMHL